MDVMAFTGYFMELWISRSFSILWCNCCSNIISNIFIHKKNKKIVVPTAWIEQATFSLPWKCSTVWAMWALVSRELSNFIRDLHNFNRRSKSVLNAGAKMGIHYDYKSTRGEKAMKKEAKRKARIEQRRAKKASHSSNKVKRIKCMTLINPLLLKIWQIQIKIKFNYEIFC